MGTHFEFYASELGFFFEKGSSFYAEKWQSTRNIKN